MSVAETNRIQPGLFLSECRLPNGAVAPDLLILNQPIANFDVFSRLWMRAGYRICADGGANRLYDLFEGDLENLRGDYVKTAVATKRHMLTC